MSVLDLAEEANRLPVISGVFPLCAMAVFIVLGFVTWSYRDVANRHAAKEAANTQHESGHGAGH